MKQSSCLLQVYSLLCSMFMFDLTRRQRTRDRRDILCLLQAHSLSQCILSKPLLNKAGILSVDLQSLLTQNTGDHFDKSHVKGRKTFWKRRESSYLTEHFTNVPHGSKSDKVSLQVTPLNILNCTS